MQVTIRPSLHCTLIRQAGRTCMEEERHVLSFLWGKRPPGSSITVSKLLSSRTNSQQWPLMKELELGESNEWLSFINKEGSHWIHLLSTAGVVRCPHVRTGPTAALCTVWNSSSFYMGTSLTVVTNVCLHCGGRVNLSDGNSKRVLLPLRMRNGGSGWVRVFVLALAFSTYPALGILKKTCPVPSSVRCPHCVPFPSLVKVKTKPAQTRHC